MNHHDHIICEIIAMHHSEKDIESIARVLRLRETEEKWDIHRIGSIIGSYVNNLAHYKKQD